MEKDRIRKRAFIISAAAACLLITLSPARLSVFPILLLIMTFYGAQISKEGWIDEAVPKTDGYDRAYLSRAQTKYIRAAACIGIILHHLVQQVTVYGTYSRGPVTIFNDLGVVFTALFFFFSGYGLLTSLETKPDYLSTFLQKRLPAVLIPFWVINLLGVLLERCMYGMHGIFSSAVSQVLGLTLINSNGWFIVEIVILYLLFFLIFSLVRKRDFAIALLCAASVLLMAYSFRQGHDVGNKAHWFRGEWWYNSTIAFPFGLLYARCKQKIDRFCSGQYPIVLGATTLLCAAAVYASIYAVRHYGYYEMHGAALARRDALITLSAQMAACLTSVALVLLLNMKIRLGNRVLKYLAGISTELFLIHGFFVNRIFGNVRMPDFLRFVVVISCSIACTAVISPCVSRLVRMSTAFLVRWKLPWYRRRRAAVYEPGSRAEIEYREKRRRRLKIVAGIGAAVSICALLWLGVGRDLMLRREYALECERISKAAPGDEVQWGRFETDPVRPGRERLAWIVLKQENGMTCLLSEKGIAGACYNHKYEEVSWEESDLRELLNSETFTGMFSRYEAGSVVPVNGDIISLLTVKEAEKAFASNQERELAITSAAQYKGTNVNFLSKANWWDVKGYRSSWWWLRGENGERSKMAPIVTVDGTIVPDGEDVSRTKGAIRPVIWVECTD